MVVVTVFTSPSIRAYVPTFHNQPKQNKSLLPGACADGDH